MRMKELNYSTLVKLNQSSIRAGRKQHVPPERMPSELHAPYPVNCHMVRESAGQQYIRMSVVLTAGGQTAWLDVSPKEYAAIPEIEVSELEWEAAVCAGTPPSVP